ncbi:alkylation response protein AidB-like acyl-CoA dehydrogenase [Amycolatopsis bartoniae]|uniref:Acyl-CoA dehydrogenase n=1 Tax=Amycolatopsis bartoniae TaxID=941986 RepID=A0A8H9MAB4_9PSEU|nr:acyl-CoA dehydrogenase family protein [Amycolatopsis bartoniae]MBB2939950.1 alkylation response protein AidB-like acyl-CoA dehydrogenase [Amycolatopsis bartoniae]TVT10128.1 acyl-CoA dehydrogenase [Amycolatopsis bartoniae]GHF35528.1 acyl-CoA dehydrogenase [Amycolatopsis bartoniae]
MNELSVEESVDFRTTPELAELAQIVRGFLDKHAPVTVPGEPTPYDAKVWRLACDQLELAALALPERYGGAGFGVTEQAVAASEMGRALLASPYFASVVLAANTLLVSGDDEVCAEVLPGLARGTTTAAVAWQPCDKTIVDGEVRLSGSMDAVLDGATADFVVVPADSSLYLVDTRSADVGRTALSGLDWTRPHAALELDGVPARPFGTPGAATGVLRDVRRLATVVLAAEQAGAGERVLEMTVEYSLDRVQFGRPIGSFQAIKHKCAELLVRLRCARAAVDYAAKVADVRPDALELAAALAGSSATNAFLTTCLDSIQIHGGVGFTWEHRAHLYLRRALSSERLLGDPARHAETLGRLLGV